MNNEKPYLLVKYDDNWADEMNISGFILVAYDDWVNIKLEVAEYFKKKPKGWVWGIGSNEGMEFVDFSNWNTFREKPLTQQELDTILTTFGFSKYYMSDPRILGNFGFFPLPYYEGNKGYTVDKYDEDYEEDPEGE